MPTERSGVNALLAEADKDSKGFSVDSAVEDFGELKQDVHRLLRISDP